MGWKEINRWNLTAFKRDGALAASEDGRHYDNPWLGHNQCKDFNISPGDRVTVIVEREEQPPPPTRVEVREPTGSLDPHVYRHVSTDDARQHFMASDLRALKMSRSGVYEIREVGPLPTEREVMVPLEGVERVIAKWKDSTLQVILGELRRLAALPEEPKPLPEARVRPVPAGTLMSDALVVRTAAILDALSGQPWRAEALALLGIKEEEKDNG